MFGNPVPGIIAPKGSGVAGQFRVVSTFQDHVIAKRPPGVDIGNGMEGAAVFAAATGIVAERFQDPNGALVLRVQHPALTGRPTTGYAHLRTITVQKGQLLQRGQQLGTVGSSGAPGQPHLHWGVNIGGKEVDGWPLLDQNQEDDVDPALYNPIATCTVLPGGTLYGDVRRQTVIAKPWEGGSPVGVYALPTSPTIGGKASLVPVQIGPAAPGGPLRIGWVGRDKVTNILSAGAAAAAVAAAAVSEAKGYQ